MVTDFITSEKWEGIWFVLPVFGGIGLRGFEQDLMASGLVGKVGPGIEKWCQVQASIGIHKWLEDQWQDVMTAVRQSSYSMVEKEDWKIIAGVCTLEI